MYYGELGRIERCYGSVAEYNRCRDENDFYYASAYCYDESIEDFRPMTEEECEAIDRENEEFDRKAKKANGIPSNMAKMFRQNMNATSNFSEEAYMKAIKKISNHYDIQFVECENPNEVAEYIDGRYAICLYFGDFGYDYDDRRYFIVNNLDFVKFCDVYRDANHIGFMVNVYMYNNNREKFDAECYEASLGEFLVMCSDMLPVIRHHEKAGDQ